MFSKEMDCIAEVLLFIQKILYIEQNVANSIIMVFYTTSKEVIHVKSNGMAFSAPNQKSK